MTTLKLKEIRVFDKGVNSQTQLISAIDDNPQLYNEILPFNLIQRLSEDEIEALKNLGIKVSVRK